MRKAVSHCGPLCHIYIQHVDKKPSPCDAKQLEECAGENGGGVEQDGGDGVLPEARGPAWGHGDAAPVRSDQFYHVL